MSEEESRPWTAEDYESLKEIRTSLISYLWVRNVWSDIVMNRIANIQDRLFDAYLLLPQWRNLVSAMSEGSVREPSIENGRTTGFLDNLFYADQWEKVYGKSTNGQEQTGARDGSIEQTRQSLLDSSKGIEFDIVNDDSETVEHKMSSALIYLHQMRKLLPEKARPISTYMDHISKMCNEIGLEVLREALDERIKGFVDCL